MPGSPPAAGSPPTTPGPGHAGEDLAEALPDGAFRRAGFASIAHARRYYGRDDQPILALHGYA